ncbi:TPA: hypothetical protein HA281_02195 [Candidatus Woesearchaeota archaeon]|nr:hypothetical protein [Deltaproteobacteria bacterium]HIH91591.1 hypothetical protein [Candidatus Woesearchaeota archaeon]HII63990.1 hypothetical protein [Candidatus Woesearchaeota archaeon]HIJ18452.1 hypothetical protein [Candidatus Woesearchaeota archaeon]
MRIVIDTNILISREQNTVLSSELQELLRLIDEGGHQLVVHPLSLKELVKDKDEERRKVNLSKVGAYNKLEEPANPIDDEGFLLSLKIPLPIKNTHDEIDINLIYAIHKNSADFLITEDRGIHTKAELLKLSDRVFDVTEALTYFKRLSPSSQRVISPPAIKDVPMHNINLDDPFFRTLKGDYGDGEFVDWWNRKSREGRKAWVYYVDGKIGALLVYKIEEEIIDTNPPLPKKRRLKICTLQVVHLGHKIGELFIKMSVKFAVNSDVDEVYLTHFSKEEDFLLSLVKEFGFLKVGKNQRGEDVLLKKLVPETAITSPLEMLQNYFPSVYEGISVRKFIIPIRPEYHNRLFTDYEARQPSLVEFQGQLIIEGNTIRKAYLCHSKITRIRSGDIVLFYRSIDRKSLTSLGVVEKVINETTDSEYIIKEVGKRTVYTKKEIETMAKEPTKVILFSLNFHFPQLVPLEKLKAERLLFGTPQSITEINHQQYFRIIELSGLKQKYFFNN